MYNTEHGDFDGNSWEQFCQQCFKLKYERDGYQELPAWRGDLGIEGFTRTGIVFQCYCPDDNYNPDLLYSKQRDKITADLAKLIKNEVELKKYLGKQKIVKWIFVTPQYQNKELVRHCAEKAKEFREKNIDILHEDFDILVHDLDFFTEQIPLVIDAKSKTIEINHELETKENTNLWIESQIDLVATAKRKNSHRISPTALNRDEKIEKLTEITISNFLNGNITIVKLQQKFPEDYEKFMRAITQFEIKVEELCLTNNSDNGELYSQIASELKAKIKSNFHYLNETTIDRLTEQVLAEWILRCPINFE
ncbi:hypothetical protein [Faecalibacter sp. LW9]|uniref:hypothetical protein n=1 Tax=Faecalibacter sp. LW9 TaxID=3103144 RepID=UPI002AFF1143|nr:hypothetical protein [Faecalibacter sp. LW9]